MLKRQNINRMCLVKCSSLFHILEMYYTLYCTIINVESIVSHHWQVIQTTSGWGLAVLRCDVAIMNSSLISDNFSWSRPRETCCHFSNCNELIWASVAHKPTRPNIVVTLYFTDMYTKKCIWIMSKLHSRDYIINLLVI